MHLIDSEGFSSQIILLFSLGLQSLRHRNCRGACFGGKQLCLSKGHSPTCSQVHQTSSNNLLTTSSISCQQKCKCCMLLFHNGSLVLFGSHCALTCLGCLIICFPCDQRMKHKPSQRSSWIFDKKQLAPRNELVLFFNRKTYWKKIFFSTSTLPACRSGHLSSKACRRLFLGFEHPSSPWHFQESTVVLFYLSLLFIFCNSA